jgi:hypothetical protein
LQSFIQDAKAFSDLINPAILKIDFDTADVERLYNIVDYSVVSQHHEPVEHNFTSASLAANPDIAQWLSFGNEKDDQLFNGGISSTSPLLLLSKLPDFPTDTNPGGDYLDVVTLHN